MAAINYIYDCTFTIQGAGKDDGNKYLTGDSMPTGATARTLTGTPITFDLDTCQVQFGRNAEDHSAGSTEYEHFRTKKKTQAINLGKKLEINDQVAAIFAANDVVVFSVTAKTGGGGALPEPYAITSALALVGDASGNFGAPSDTSIALLSYGRPFN